LSDSAQLSPSTPPVIDVIFSDIECDVAAVSTGNRLETVEVARTSDESSDESSSFDTRASTESVETEELEFGAYMCDPDEGDVVVAFFFGRLVCAKYQAMTNSLYIHDLMTHVSERVAIDPTMTRVKRAAIASSRSWRA
jgi:hypothetical protein